METVDRRTVQGIERRHCGGAGALDDDQPDAIHYTRCGYFISTAAYSLALLRCGAGSRDIRNVSDCVLA